MVGGLFLEAPAGVRPRLQPGRDGGAGEGDVERDFRVGPAIMLRPEHVFRQTERLGGFGGGPAVALFAERQKGGEVGGGHLFGFPFFRLET